MHEQRQKNTTKMFSIFFAGKPVWNVNQTGLESQPLHVSQPDVHGFHPQQQNLLQHQLPRASALQGPGQNDCEGSNTEKKLSYEDQLVPERFVALGAQH